jgi:APA family basic amino acid/polyamine antiporter
MPANHQALTRLRLQRKLKVTDGTALIISNVIGVGIFTTPAVIAKLVPHPGAMLLLWVAGGLLSLAGAFTYAELARLCPEAGGEYNYLSHAFGPLAGFLSGWVSLIAGFSGAVAANAVALMGYLGPYLPKQISTSPLAIIPLGLARISISRQSLLASAIILLFALIHLLGLGPGKLVQRALAAFVLGAIAVFVVAGFYFGRGSWSHFHASGATFRTRDWLLALIPVMFTYSGWNAAAYVSEEMHDSERSVGTALALGTSIVVLVYLALNTLYVLAISMPEMGASINVAAVAMQRLVGAGGNYLVPVLVIALLGAISAMTIAGPRVYFAMARDGVFLPVFARINPRFHTPDLAILLQAACSVGLVLLGSFEQILIYTGFAITLSVGATATALYVIRRRRKVHGPTLAMLAIPGTFAAVSFLMVANAIYNAPRLSLFGLALIAAGVPVFLFSRRRLARTSS